MSRLSTVRSIFVWGASERRVKAIEMPGQVAEVAADDLALAHGGLAATKAEDCIILAVPELEVVWLLFVASTCSRSWSECVFGYSR